MSFDITGSAGPVSITGHTDDIRKPFTLAVSSPGASGSATATPNANGLSGKISGTSQAATFNEFTTGSYTLTKTETGYSGKGTVKTCIDLANKCSNSGLFRLTFTRPSA